MYAGEPEAQANDNASAAKSKAACAENGNQKRRTETEGIGQEKKNITGNRKKEGWKSMGSKVKIMGKG